MAGNGAEHRLYACISSSAAQGEESEVQGHAKTCRAATGVAAVAVFVAMGAVALVMAAPFRPLEGVPTLDLHTLMANKTMGLSSLLGWCTAVRGGVAVVGQPLVTAPCHPDLPAQQLMFQDGKIQWVAHPDMCASLGQPQGQAFALVLDLCRTGQALQRLEGQCIANSQEGVFDALVLVHRCPAGGQRAQPAPQPAGLQTAGPPQTHLGADLFCWMAVLPGSYEVGLKDLAARLGASIFACETHQVYNSYPAQKVTQGSWTSFSNRDSFIRVWKDVLANGLWKQRSWTVKVDPDAVWLPDRLRKVLSDWHVKEEVAAYVPNTLKDNGFLGPIEILSRMGVQVLEGTYQTCRWTSITAPMGEDGWLKGCLDDAKVAAWADTGILSSSRDIATCDDHSYIAYHDFKDAGQWQDCFWRAQ